MNPNLCRIALRPRGPFEVLDLSLRLARVRWWPLLVLGLWTVLPLTVVGTVLSWLLDGHPALLVIPLVAAAPLQAVYTLLVGRLLFSDEVSLAEVIRDVFARLPSLVGAWLAILAGSVAIGAPTCGYGLPFVQGATLYMTEAALLERVPLSRGANRSLRLAGASAGQTAAGILVRWATLVWFTAASEACGQAIVGFVLQLGAPFGTAMDGTITPFVLFGLLIAQPAWAIYRLLLYVDVRTRIEGWDLQVALRAAGLDE